MKRNKVIVWCIALSVILCSGFQNAKAITSTIIPQSSASLQVSYVKAGESPIVLTDLPVIDVSVNGNAKVSRYRNKFYQVVIHEIDRGNFTEINGEVEYLAGGNSCITLRISIPLKGENWKWYSELEKSDIMESGVVYMDAMPVRTARPPDGAFNGKTLADGGYGDAVELNLR